MSDFLVSLPLLKNKIMGRIRNKILYNLQAPIKLSDYWIGTDGVSFDTKNFTASGVVELVLTNLGMPTANNRLLFVGEITQGDGAVTFSQIDWVNNGNTFSVENAIQVIEPADEGYYRIDIEIAKSDGTVGLIQGQQSEVNPVAPPTPDGSIFVTSINVFGDVVNTGNPVYAGFMEIEDESQFPFFNSGEVFDLLWNTKKTYRWSPKRGISEINLHSMSVTEGGDYTDSLFDGRLFTLINDGNGEINVIHESEGDIPFYIAGQRDLLISPRYVAVFKYSVITNRLEFVSLSINKAGDLQYTNPAYPNIDSVAQALDSLLYITPVINSLVNTVGTVEKGTVVTSVTLNWVVNKLMSTESLNQGIGLITPSLTTYTHSGQSITANRVYTLTVGDGVNTASASTTVGFLNKRYWGTSVNTTLNNAQVLSLSSELSGTRVQTKTIDGGGAYIYLAYPTSFGLPNMKVNGLEFTAITTVTLSFTNSHGFTENYYIIRTNTVQNGSLLIDVL